MSATLKAGQYFSIHEIIYSATAEKENIFNLPTDEKIINNLNELISFLDALREAWGSAIRVGSGYRCPQLNKAVGGSTTSVHMIGLAADLTPVNGKTDDFFEFVKNYLLSNNIPFDQIIDEHSGKKHWVHIGLKNTKGLQRKQVKGYKDGKYYFITTK